MATKLLWDAFVDFETDTLKINFVMATPWISEFWSKTFAILIFTALPMSHAIAFHLYRAIAPIIVVEIKFLIAKLIWDA